MQSAAERMAGRDAGDIQAAIERFLKASRQPALLEPGEELLILTGDNYAIDLRNSRLTLQAWDRSRNLARRVTGIREETAGRLELVIERFARREGKLFLVDLGRPAGFDAGRRSARFVLRERFRQFLTRQFPDWTLAELSADANLEHSLSPVFPRALLRKRHSGWAAIAAPPEGSDADCILSFGLIWLDYLRRRERRVTIEGLALYLPCGEQRTTCLRLPYLNQFAARYELFLYSEQDFMARADAQDSGNLDTRLEPCHAPAAPSPEIERLLGIPGVESVRKQDGTVSLRVRGVEFAQAAGGTIQFGLAERVKAREHNFQEVERLAQEVAHWRSPAVSDREHPLYRQNPEAWLESQVRAQIEILDASLLPEPIYDQVPAFAGGQRGVLDLLAVDRTGRLAVLELKASADIHLPLQALDYWIRVKWHLDRNEFSECGYFPGIPLRRDPPRLLLVSPTLDFHPSTEVILSYFSPDIDVERLGVGVEWRKGLQVMFRLRGAERP